MKIRGTQETVKPLEQNAFKVYIRSNIVRVDEEDTEESTGFHGWEYNEIEMPITEYQEYLRGKITQLEADNAQLWYEIMMGGV